MSKYTKRQCLILTVFCIAQVFTALAMSIQAPFYPKEAEEKGAVPSQYGFVFGVYHLVVFLFCPIYGKFLNDIGVKLVNNTGIFTIGFSCILFSFLEKIDGVMTFVAFSFAIRIIEATGAAAFNTAAYSIIAKEFPENVGATFALLETFFGIGFSLGPAIGEALYEVGGFMLPFALVGVLLIFASFLILCLLPNHEETTVIHTSKGLMSLLRLPPILLGVVTVFSSSFSVVFVQATLEPHLRPLSLTSLQLGLMFMLNGAGYALSAPMWGRLCDRWVSPQFVCSLGALFICSAFVLIGPAPFLPLHMSIPLCIVALIIHGLGMGAELIATFSGFLKDAITLGFSDDLGTYGLVSGLWTSSFALGAFVGPSTAGVLFDTIGFPWASQIVVGLHCLIFLLTVPYIIFWKEKFLSKFQGISSEGNKKHQPFARTESELTEFYGSVN